MTLLEKMRCMLSNANMGKQFWVEALSYATFMVNQLPCSGKALFFGTVDGVKGFKLWCLQDKKIVISRDVTFDEECMLKTSSVEKVSFSIDGEKETSNVVVQMEVTPSLGPLGMDSRSGSKEDRRTPDVGSSQ